MGGGLSDAAFNKIMELTERHPYYVNYLCDALCSEKTTLPNETDVVKSWLEVIEEERSDLIKDFFSLPSNQRKLMIHIANHKGENIYSAETAKKIDIVASSVSRALLGLLEKDYIEKINDDYRLVVPAYKQLLMI